ncbi:MAG: hypothetical protein HOE19_03585 [Candidatus Komeilibacteria bacterium]|jgi:hypothetical protein|nr:hypothetical protein [Candidatus Komeilibacteria bacterium]MBT4447758.1 hypothetical protein [Candidatus Komeilibacteria bacterium]
MNLLMVDFKILVISVAIVFILIGIIATIKLLLNIINRLQESVIMLKTEIKSSVQSKFLQISQDTKDFVELAIEVWRLERKINSLSDSIDDNKKKIMENSVHKLKGYLKRHDVEIREYHEEKYTEGMNVEILSVEQMDNLKWPMIKETIEPAIIVKGHFVNKAKVILLKNKK